MVLPKGIDETKEAGTNHHFEQTVWLDMDSTQDNIWEDIIQ